jgi:hypothetical protein
MPASFAGSRRNPVSQEGQLMICYDRKEVPAPLVATPATSTLENLTPTPLTSTFELPASSAGRLACG